MHSHFCMSGGHTGQLFDHAAIARAMGCFGIRVETPDQLADALREAIAARRPAVIDVVTALDAISFADDTTPLLDPPRPETRNG